MKIKRTEAIETIELEISDAIESVWGRIQSSKDLSRADRKALTQAFKEVSNMVLPIVETANTSKSITKLESLRAMEGV